MFEKNRFQESIFYGASRNVFLLRDYLLFATWSLCESICISAVLLQSLLQRVAEFFSVSYLYLKSIRLINDNYFFIIFELKIDSSITIRSFLQRKDSSSPNLLVDRMKVMALDFHFHLWALVLAVVSLSFFFVTVESLS